jgi:glycosyltransferase involved in cell wall biosynthesis
VPDQTDTLFTILGPVARRVWAGAAAATAVSSFVQDLAQRAYHRPVTRILNGVNLTDTPRQPPSQLGTPPHLVFLGRLNPQKNAPLLIDALSQITGHAWKLTLIGDGPDLPAVLERVVGHGLQSRVTLKGWLRAEAVQEILATGDVLCMPSSSEGMPVAAVEALKNGLAIAASDIPGVRDVVQDGINGWVTPVNDTRAYADRLRNALDAPDQLNAMKAASWEKARQFELGVIGAEYAEVLFRAAGGNLR